MFVLLAGGSKTGDFTSHVFTKEALYLKSGYLSSGPKCGENWNQHRLSDGHSHFSLLVCWSFGMFKLCSMTNVNWGLFLKRFLKITPKSKYQIKVTKKGYLIWYLVYSCFRKAS